MTHKVLILGAGKIGTQIACILTNSQDYQVVLADQQLNGVAVKRLLKTMPQITTTTIDVSDHTLLQQTIDDNAIEAVISSLPYYVNVDVAKIAAKCQIHYFDLTEDVATTAAVKKIAAGKRNAFVPQCGLAPGFINIAANSLMQRFERLDNVKLCVGALPQHSDNALGYALSWSTDGLINEYGNLCQAIVNGESVMLPPLEGLELIELGGCVYEAFNTSGGLGGLIADYAGKVNNLHYKSIRYPGHCEKMRFLMNDLKLNQDRQTLKQILENALPQNYQDVVIIYVSVSGWRDDIYSQEIFTQKLYPQHIADLHWQAIQLSTAAGVCALLDQVLADPSQYQGLVLQQQFSLEDFLVNRFGQYYQYSTQRSGK